MRFGRIVGTDETRLVLVPCSFGLTEGETACTAQALNGTNFLDGFLEPERRVNASGKRALIGHTALVVVGSQVYCTFAVPGRYGRRRVCMYGGS